VSYPNARRVELTLADLRRLTILERARAAAVVGVAADELGPLLRSVGGHGTPEEIERAVELLYAIAWQLERRLEPAVTWEEAQSWELALNLEAETADPVADAEAAASVEAAIATGLPPAVAGELSLAQLDAYREARLPESKRRRQVARRSRRTA
jgi:hypothetical protein